MSDGRKVVLVLFGGQSAEHEISILSARFIVSELDRSRYEPLLVGIDRQGRWLRQSESYLLGLDPAADTVCLDPEGQPVCLHHVPAPSGRGHLLTIEGDRIAARLAFDVAFPVLHGPMGEDGTIQGLFEVANVPYVGCGVAASAATMDKVLFKQALADSGIPTVRQHVIHRTEFESTPQKALEGCDGLSLPVFVKPANMGSSLGISRVNAREDLTEAVLAALRFDDKIVVEEGLSPCREIEVAILEQDPPLASVPGEIGVTHRDGFYSYDAKYLDPEGARLDVPAKLEPGQIERVKAIALDAFRVLGCSGMARVDLFMSEEGHFFVNEINAIPGFTAISMYPRLLAESGIDAPTLLHQLITVGLKRQKQRRQRSTRRENHLSDEVL